MKAHEALAITKQALALADMPKIYKKIEKAAKEGYDFVSIDSSILNQYQINELKANGYLVIKINSFYEIGWAEKKETRQLGIYEG